MSRRFQDAVVDKLIETAESFDGVEVLTTHAYANVGTLVAKRGLTETMATLSFMFSTGHNTVSINADFFSAKQEDRFLFSETDDDKLAELIDRWWKVLAAAM